MSVPLVLIIIIFLHKMLAKFLQMVVLGLVSPEEGMPYELDLRAALQGAL